MSQRSERGRSDGALRLGEHTRDLAPTQHRIATGQSIPDLPRFAGIIEWLQIPADAFFGGRTAPAARVESQGEEIVLSILHAPEMSDRRKRQLDIALRAVMRLADPTVEPSGSQAEGPNPTA